MVLAHVAATVNEVVESKQPLTNIYAFAPSKPPSEQDVERTVRSALEEEATAYASHPAPKDRFASARALGRAGDPPRDGDDDDAWSLIADRVSLEEQMTQEVRTILRNAHGLVLPGASAR